ncbi:MAG: type II secretion system F family protein [Blautia sp.]|nr:type II secretion system F family protein [Lachnoclostridium sp.]MCM1212367.1 type II secretion system F family protein [Blautia sp.]
MIYAYLIILGIYGLLFLLSRKESASGYLSQPDKKAYPGEVFFLKAAVWCLRLKERLAAQLGAHGRNREALSYKGQFGSGQLGKSLKLLHPELSERQQVKEFQIRQCSLVLTVLFIGNLAALGVALSGSTAGVLQEGSYIYRKAHGQGQTDVALSAQIGEGEPEEILYTVEAQKYTEEEIATLYQEASAHLAESILGNNESLDHVTGNLALTDSLEGYPFQISWDSSQYSLVHTDGSVHNEELEEGQVVMLTASFQYEDITFEEVFPVQVQPVVYTQKEQLLRELTDSLEEQNQASRTGQVLRLPEYLGSQRITWKEVVKDSSGYFFLLTCIAAALLLVSGRKKIDEDLEKRKKELLLDYPEIISKLTLYMGAGMTIRSAFLKMGEDYKKRDTSGRKRYVYEEILLLCHELQSGVSETEAYTHLGKRCQLQHYRKLCALLSQNLRKGSNDLLIMLQQEAVNAFEERKNTAKKLGEEAGTKLLVPMMMMLCIVMALIMVPAFLSFA